MSEVPRAINSTNKIERDNDWIGELMNPARIKAIKAPVIARVFIHVPESGEQDGNDEADKQ